MGNEKQWHLTPPMVHSTLRFAEGVGTWPKENNASAQDTSENSIKLHREGEPSQVGEGRQEQRSGKGQ